MGDFEALEVCFPPDKGEQQRIIAAIRDARAKQRDAIALIKAEMLTFSDLVDGRHDGELPDIQEAECTDDGS